MAQQPGRQLTEIVRTEPRLLDISRCYPFAESTLALADANSCYNFGRGIGREPDGCGQVTDSDSPLPGQHGQQTRESVTMATFQLPTRRLILAGGFAVAIAAAPAVAMFAVPTNGGSAPSVSACAGGEIEDQFTNICVPDIVPNSPRISAAPPRSAAFRRSVASRAPDTTPVSASGSARKKTPRGPSRSRIRRSAPAHKQLIQ